MPDWGSILDIVWNSFARFGTPQSDLYWLYFVSAAAIAFIFYWLSHYDNDVVSVRGFLAFCFPKRVYAHPSAKLDYKYAVINAVLHGWVIAPLALVSMVTAQGTMAVMIGVFDSPALPLGPKGWWADFMVTLAAAVAADLAFFVAHYLQHRLALLWEFHKVHHAAEVLHPLTQYRQHPIDTAIDLLLMGSATGLVLGISAYLFMDALEGVTILEINAVVFLFNVTGKHLRHSHVPLSYGPVISRLLISPLLHQVHHSCAPQHLDKNYGGFLSIWDQLAGTFYVPRSDEALKLGLVGGEHRDYNSVLRLYLLPFAKNVRRWGRVLSEK